MKNGLGVVALLGAVAAAAAQAAEPELMVQVGRSGTTDMAGVGLRLGPMWTSEWGRFDVGLHPEFQLNRHRWRDADDPSPRALWQAGATAMLQGVYGEGEWRPYFEVGLGANYLTSSELGDAEYSTRFQFGEHLGVGLKGDSFFAGLRLSHYSNGGIKRPNNGLNAAQLVVGARF